MTDVRLIAHRGSSARYPEHTRAAYQQAVEEGADGIETDVRLTADGTVVCWHDATVDRTSRGTGRLEDWSLEDLNSLDLLHGQEIAASHGDPAHQLMTLDALLELARAARRPLLLAIELKASGSPDLPLVTGVLDALARAGWDRSSGRLDEVQISLQCFNVRTAAALLDEVPADLVMLLTEPGHGDTEAGFELLDAAALHAGPCVKWAKSDPSRVELWLAQGRTVRMWTVDTLEDLDFCLAMGVREITTNRPAELRAALDARLPLPA